MKEPKIHIPSNIVPYPSLHEISAAIILSEYFQSDISSIRRNHMHTADFLINNQIWEHKSPIGDSKRTIQNNLRKASHQSPLVIVDLRRCKMHSMQAKNRIIHEFDKSTGIKHLILIKKNKKVLEIIRNT